MEVVVLSAQGIVPLYENTRVPSDEEYEQFLAGNPPWRLGGSWAQIFLQG